MDKAKVYIKENKERFISELLDLLRIPSISAQSERKPDMQRCAEFLAAALVKAGADRAGVFKPVYDDKQSSATLMLLMPMMINA